MNKFNALMESFFPEINNKIDNINQNKFHAVIQSQLNTHIFELYVQIKDVRGERESYSAPLSTSDIDFIDWKVSADIVEFLVDNPNKINLKNEIFTVKFKFKFQHVNKECLCSLKLETDLIKTTGNKTRLVFSVKDLTFDKNYDILFINKSELKQFDLYLEQEAFWWADWQKRNSI